MHFSFVADEMDFWNGYFTRCPNAGITCRGAEDWEMATRVVGHLKRRPYAVCSV